MGLVPVPILSPRRSTKADKSIEDKGSIQLVTREILDCTLLQR